MFKIEIREYAPFDQNGTGALLRTVLVQELETLNLEKVIKAINGMQDKRSHKRKRGE